MSSSNQNLRISSSVANAAPRTRRSNRSVLAKFQYRQNVYPSGVYNPLSSLKANYLQNLDIEGHAERMSSSLYQGRVPEENINWIDQEPIYRNALDIATQFKPSRGRDDLLFSKAFAEFILEMEKVVQKRFLNREFIEDANQHGNGSVQRALLRGMGQTAYHFGHVSQQSIKNVQEITRRFQTIPQSFWQDQNYKNKWSSDFRSLMDDSIKMIMHTFSPNPNVSYFGELIPDLKDYTPEMFIGTPTHRRPKGFIYKMDGNRDFLRVIFNIMMIRFPSVNVDRSDVWSTFSIPIMLERGTEVVNSSQSTVVESNYLSNVNVDYTNAHLKNLFYYIPDQERVLGIWPKNVRVSRGDGGDLSTLAVNYNCQMIRSVLCRIRLLRSDLDMGSKINFMMLFNNEQDNIYTRVRRLDPFEFGPDIDPWVPLFVSMTFFSETNDKILHVPWVIESNQTAFSPSYDGDASSLIRYDCRELIRMIIEILEGRISGRNVEEDNGQSIYVMIKFINEHPKEYYQRGVRELQEDRESDNRNLRRRIARTPQQSHSIAPSNPLNVLVGAPYAGTKKEKMFLHFSMMDRFQFNDALFQTPQRNTTYSCFMMAILRCQMYLYSYQQGQCTDVLVTNGPRADMTCQGKLVESTMDYSQVYHLYPFLKKMGDEIFLHLFNNVKYTENGKYLPGARDEKEIQYWEMVADEIWLHLERFRGREINYNDLGDYGQAFADFFGVCISIYDIEYRGNRISVLSPYRKSPQELAESGEILMIHIVFDQGHIHAVNNLRSFIRSKKRKSDVRQYHYCPICDKKQTDELTSSKESALKHITKCTMDKEAFMTGFQKEEEVKMESQLSQVRVAFKKQQGKTKKIYECIQCNQEVNQMTYQGHVCTIQKKKLESIPNEKIYVWDVEAAQIQDDYGLLKHECNCVYIRRVYPDNWEQEQGRYFPSEIEFVDALMTEAEFQGSVFLAHNSGSYDIHFLLRVFERSEIDHTYTPSPTSKHKFIKVYLVERDVHFLDFIRFMPGSLRGIAESFQIPVSKGDFPYKFNNGLNDSYVGPIPPLDTEDDWWGLKEAKSQKQIDSFQKWFQDQCLIYCDCSDQECHCTKCKWNFQTELKKYCLLDVIVLAEVVKAYRNKAMNFENEVSAEYPDSQVAWKAPVMDPFQFMTLPQITMQTLVHGFTEQSFDHYGFSGITSYFDCQRSSRCPEALLWLYRRASLDNVHILSRENCLREFYDFTLKMSFDGYAPMTNTIYVFLKCSFWGCPTCCREYHETNAILPERGICAKDVEENYEVVMYHLHSNYNVVSIWQHEFHTSFMDPYLLKCSQQLNPADCFYGGRTEVFKLYCNSDHFPNDEIHYYDVTSLYPSVYAHRLLPIGTPRYFIGYDVDKTRLSPSHPDRYFGYARIKVIPPSTDRIGLLPQRDPQTQRLTFPVYPMEGCWFTEEIYLAVENGYLIEEVYEVYHWGSNQLSDQHLRGYVGYFLRIKQESEGWKKLGASTDHPTEEEQNEIADRLYIQNGHLARIRPEKVKLDPVMRALAKLYLNSLWGKWAQKPSKECHTTIYGTQQFFQLWNDRTIDRESCLFRDISPGVYKVSYKKKNSFINPVPHGNVWIAAAVTAWARITLHRQMLVIGPERLIYCDTDSIIFLWPKNGVDLSGIGLGKWTDEYPKNRIVKVYALAPKLYALTLGPKQPSATQDTYESFRAKGVQMTLANQTKMSFQHILPLIQKTITDKETTHTIEVNNFNIFSNSTNNQLPFGNLFSRYNTKKVRVIITKRTIEEMEECDFDSLKEINTYPPGYLH